MAFKCPLLYIYRYREFQRMVLRSSDFFSAQKVLAVVEYESALDYLVDFL